MRFSSLFNFPLTQRTVAAPEAVARVEEPAALRAMAPEPASSLPEDLDQRVRLVGEWQMDTEW